MHIEDLDISAMVADKIASKHNISVEEVYEVFWNEDYKVLIRRSDKVPGTYLALGRTEAGRYLTVVFAPRSGNLAKVITARDMAKVERRLYAKRK